MTEHNNEMTAAGIATARFNELIEQQLNQGLTQTRIGAMAGIPATYLSDIKRGQRPVTELIARRLGEELSFNYRWLLGTSDTMQPAGQPTTATAAGDAVWLPLLPWPIQGEPRLAPKWSGARVEVAGVAAAKVGLATQPYVLQFTREDLQNRLRPGDLILISQATNPKAEIHVVGSRNRWYLARANKDGSWTRVATGKPLEKKCPVAGHGIGVIWSALA